MSESPRPLPPPPFARGFDPSNEYSVVQLAQAASTQYVDLMEDLFHDGDVSDSTTSHRSPGLSRKSPGTTRTVRGREPPPTRILDFLFLGNVLDAKNTAFLHENNIKTIINVSTEQYWLDDNSIHVHSFVAHDTANFEIAPLFPVTGEIIEQVRHRHYLEKNPKLRERVLVHCQKGRSRSATAVIAYLIRSNGWTVHQAMSYVVKRRECVEPNIGFVEALKVYQESFSVDDRQSPMARLGLHVRGVTESMTANEIAAFFENVVGPVMDAKPYAPKGSAASSKPEGEDAPQVKQEEVEAAQRSPIKGSSSNGLSEGDTQRGGQTNPACDDLECGKQRSGKNFLVVFACTESVSAAIALFKRKREVFVPLTNNLEQLKILPVARVLQKKSGKRAPQTVSSASPETATSQGES